MSKEYLPIRVVQPDANFLHKNSAGGSEPKWFIEESEYRDHQKFLIHEIGTIERELSSSFREYPHIPSVIKASLHSDALAKSHRPKGIFNEKTCPVIGVDSLGELLLRTTKEGLVNLKVQIEEPSSKKQKANITTIADIKNLDLDDKLKGLCLRELTNRAEKNQEFYLKVMLFDYQDHDINSTVEDEFTKWLGSKDAVFEKIVDFENLSIWRVVGKDATLIEELCQNPSVKTVSYFPSFGIGTLNSNLIEADSVDYPVPEMDVDYPKIGVIDSGISNEHPVLKPWIVEKIIHDPEIYQDNSHGSFVGGLVCMGQHLNGKDICPDQELVKIVDVQILPDPSEETVTEDDLILRLQQTIPDLVQKHKLRVWNMSLGLGMSVDDELFSSLGIFLDAFQDENDIIITLPSGNYEDINQRKWPPQNDILDKDRLRAPADSVRAITVGAIACKDRNDSIVRKNQPASYSCKGLGPGYIVKPELVHYSGNFSSEHGVENQGIISFDETGSVTENLGTSFSCPLVARTLAILDHKLAPSVSNSLIKALAVHHSKIPDETKVHDDFLPYVGFGMPDSAEDILSCTESSITLVFEQEIFQGHSLNYPFVWPNSLTSERGKCRGNVAMTLVAGVPLDSDFGCEYIRANISASLGAKTFDRSKNKYKFVSKLKEDPELKSGLYEEELIKNGYKWKPVKRYSKSFIGIKTDEWRIHVSLLLRDEVFLDTTPLKFALIFTISDPEGIAPVYDEVVLGLENENVITNPIQLRGQIQQRISN